MNKLKVIVKGNKKVVSIVGVLILVVSIYAGVVLVKNNTAYQVALTDLRAHGLENYHEGNTFVKKETITNMVDLLEVKKAEAEEFMAKVEAADLVKKYEVKVEETVPVTIKAMEVKNEVIEKQNIKKEQLVQSGTAIINSKTAYNNGEKSKLDSFKTSYNDLAYNDDIFINEETLTKCQQLEKEIRKVEADAKKRIAAEKKKKEEEKNKPNNSTPSVPNTDTGYVDNGSIYVPPASGGNTYVPPVNNTPAPSAPAPSYSCPYMSVGAAEAAGQAATSGNYAVQDCGDGSYNYNATWNQNNNGSSDF